MDHLRKNFAVFCRTLATAPAPVGDGTPDVPPSPNCPLSILHYPLPANHNPLCQKTVKYHISSHTRQGVKGNEKI